MSKRAEEIRKRKKLRRTLRTRALAYLKKAEASYEECMAAPKLPEAELWQLASEWKVRPVRVVTGELWELA